jgi:hypothetical protein
MDDKLSNSKVKDHIYLRIVSFQFIQIQEHYLIKKFHVKVEIFGKFILKIIL